MSSTPHIVEKLVSLTSIRDIELLEFSLLKTLHEMFRPETLKLIKLDPVGDTRMIMCYGADGSHETSIARRDKSLPVEIESAVRMSSRLNGAYHSRLANGNSISAYPVVALNNLDITLVVESRRPGSPQDARLIQGLLLIYRNFCQLIDDAQRDQLTGLLNRKTFDEGIQRVIGLVAFHNHAPVEHERRQVPQQDQGQHWLCMIDIDNFKRINDTFGHIYGDEVLLLIAQIMRESFRESDLLFRFGGEEFVVITENADLDGAKTAFERFRARVEAHDFPQVGRVTLSFGAVKVMPDALAHQLLDQADQALYFAKSNGKNQVCFYEELVSSGRIQPLVHAAGEVEFF